jgi:hypothetical protein
VKRIIVGLIVGVCAGVVDIVPMVSRELPLQADVSAFSLWVVSGFLIATSELKLHPILKGIFIPLLVLLPNSFLIGWKEPFALIPILIMTVILGTVSGIMIHRHVNIV